MAAPMQLVMGSLLRHHKLDVVIQTLSLKHLKQWNTKCAVFFLESMVLEVAIHMMLKSTEPAVLAARTSCLRGTNSAHYTLCLVVEEVCPQ